MAEKSPLRRRFLVIVTPDEADRLRTFDNAAEGTKEWPLGPRMAFVRRRNGTLIARDWTSAGVLKAYPTSAASAEVLSDTEVEVEIKARGAWVGWTLIVCGAVVVTTVLREGIFALLMGGVLIGGGWYGYVSRLTREQPLKELEEVMRRNIRGTWREVS